MKRIKGFLAGLSAITALSTMTSTFGMTANADIEITIPEVTVPEFTYDNILIELSECSTDPNAEIKVETDNFEGIRGDVNSDGVLNVRDAAEIIVNFVNVWNDKLTAAADFDENGVINIHDCAKLCLYLGENNSDFNFEKTISEVKKLAAITTETTLSGDANDDGTVNVRDCAYIANALANGKTDSLPNTADYNKDSKKNVRDAAAISKDLAAK